MHRRAGWIGIAMWARHAGCAALFLLAACSSGSTAPSSSAAGSYQLSTYDAEPLPVVLRVIASNPVTPGGASSRCEDRLASMTLVLGQTGRFTRTSERRLVCDTGVADEVTHPAEMGTFTTEGETVTLTFGEADGVVTVATGVRTATSLTITKKVTTSQFGTVTDPTRLEFLRTP